MKRKPSSFLILLVLLSATTTTAQVFIESAPAGTQHDAGLVVYGRTGNNDRIPYEKISGSPFWQNVYLPAMLFDKSNQLLGKAPVKLNLYTNEVYFQTPQGQERVAAAGKVRKIIFYKDNDFKDIVAVFENGLAVIPEVNPRAEDPSYVQVLNNGDAQLLKHIKIQFVTADSLFGTMKRYYFSDQIHYYMNTKFGQVVRLKKLNKDLVTETLNIDRNAEAWLREQGLSLKKEEEVIRFLDYWNGRKKS